MINWNHVKYFSADEFADPNYPGSGELINGKLVYMLEQSRRDTFLYDPKRGWPMLIHYQAGGAVDVEGSWGHSKNSYHLLRNEAKAVDFHFDVDIPIKEQIYFVLKCGFGGVGIYYNVWRYNGVLLPVAFHVDIRPKTEFLIWKCYKKGVYEYVL